MPDTLVLELLGEDIAVPPGPVHAKLEAPLVVPVNVIVPPTHSGPVVAVAEIVGIPTTVTEAVLALVVPQPLVAASVYTPALAATTLLTPVLNEVGLVIAVPPGPVQAKLVAPVAPPFNVRFWPAQTVVGVTVAVTAVGTPELTTRALVVAVVVPHKFVALKV